LRILHIAAVRFSKRNNHSNAGGISNSVPNLAQGQSENNNSVGIISTKKSDNPLTNEIYWNSVSEISLIKLIFSDPFVSIKNDFGLPDIIHTHDVYEIKAMPFIYHALKRNIKVFISPRGNLSETALSRKRFKKAIFLNLVFSFFAKSIDGFVALNEGEKMIIKKRYKNNKVIMIGNGAEDNQRWVSKYKNNYIQKMDNNIVNIGYLGRYEIHIKGLDLLMEAYSEYQRRVKEVKIKLTLIGDHSQKTNSKKYFEDIESKLKDPSMFSINGPLFNEEKLEQISNFDIFIHPSRSEGMPNAVLEAMSMSIPTMVTPGTNMGEIIKDSNSGWLVNTDSQSILEFLLKVHEADKKDMMKKGENGMKYAQNQLNWKEIGKISYS